MVKIFLFHRVSPERDALWDPMEVKLFERCVKFISSRYQVVLLEDFIKNSEKQDTNRKAVAAIVFDDGYKDNFEFARPVLDQYGVKASFYVVTGCIDKNIPTWTHLLDYAFQFTNNDIINLQFDFLPEDLQVQSIKGQQARIAYVRKLKPALKKITHEQRQLVMTEVQRAFADIKMPGFMMNWDDLRQLYAEGHYIGSHTVTHCMLGTMNDETEIRNELVQSGKKINDELGYFPFTISYPVGSFNEVTKRISHEVGYQAGLAVKQTVYYPGQDNIFEIPRIELYNEPWLKTLLRIENIPGRINKFLRRS